MNPTTGEKLYLLDLQYSMNPPMAIQQVVDKYKEGYSIICLICAGMRGGKSRKGFLFANWLSWLLFGKQWDWKSGTLIGVDNLIGKLGNGIFLMDEVQLQLARKKSMTAPSQLTFDLLTSQAYHHYIILLICPSANTLGRDHANNVDFVFPIHNRVDVEPYSVKSNRWLITADPKKIPINGLGSWDFDLENPIIKYVFKDELTQIDEFISFINTNLKEKQLTEMRERIGYIPTKPENVDWY